MRERQSIKKEKPMSLPKTYSTVVELCQPHILPDTQAPETVLAPILFPIYPGTDVG